jgi:hypothetical protein
VHAVFLLQALDATCSASMPHLVTSDMKTLNAGSSTWIVSRRPSQGAPPDSAVQRGHRQLLVAVVPVGERCRRSSSGRAS